jgi:hypothetical protein
MNDKVSQSLLRGCFSQLGVSVALMLLLFGVILGGGTLIALLPNRYLNSDMKQWAFLSLLICSVSLMLLGTMIWIVVNNARVYARFDAAFTPFGFVRHRYLLAGLRYQGQYQGRNFNVYYHVSGGRYVRVPVLELYLTGHFRTRLSLGDKNLLAQMATSVLKPNLLQLNHPAYTDLMISTIDEAWANRLLNDAFAPELIARLVDKGLPGARGLVFGPEALYVNIRHFPLSLITPEAVRDWVEALLKLAALAEGLPPATQTAEASQWERASQFNRNRFWLPSFLIVAALLGVLILGIGGCLLFLLLTGQFS